MKNKIVKIILIVITLLSYCALGVFVGFFMQNYQAKYIVTCVLVFGISIATAINVLIHEAGHLVAGLLTGYRFVSFRIFSFVLLKTKIGKFTLKRSVVPGTVGQCLLSPPNVPLEKCPYKLYHASGALFNFVFSLVAMGLYLFVTPHTIVTFILLFEVAILGFPLALTNLIPAKINGLQNDGYNLFILGKNIEAKQFFNMILEINAAFCIAEKYDDVSKDLIDSIKEIDFTQKDLTDGISTNLLAYQAELYFMEGNEQKTFEANLLLANTKGVLPLFKHEANCEVLFYEIMHNTQNVNPKIDSLYDKKLQKFVKASITNPSKLRLLYAYYRFYKKDEKTAEKIYAMFTKAVKNSAVKLEAVFESALVEKLKTQNI